MICFVEPMLADAGSGAFGRWPEGIKPKGNGVITQDFLAALTPSSRAGDDL